MKATNKQTNKQTIYNVNSLKSDMYTELLMDPVVGQEWLLKLEIQKITTRILD